MILIFGHVGEGNSFAKKKKKKMEYYFIK